LTGTFIPRGIAAVAKPEYDETMATFCTQGPGSFQQ